MNIDFKLTAWGRVEIPEEFKNEVLKFLNKNPSCTSDDFYNEFGNHGIDWEVMDETTEDIPLEKNNGHSTIEVYNEDGDIIFENGNTNNNKNRENLPRKEE